jgi:transcriptional regulator with PAS, ATPase and Fis domain
VLKDSKGRVVGGAETFRDLGEIEELRRELSSRMSFGDVVSRSAAMRKVIELAGAVAASDSSVLISGETGTGKELVAKAVHCGSHRAAKPFVAVNCGALPDSLLESELFGYRPEPSPEPRRIGTDASPRPKAARSSRRNREISPAMQVRLLRVLQERCYEPLGSSKSRKCDIRVIAATNRDLEAEIAKGRFREDLFYRINVIKIELPPLRERTEDIPLLVERFMERFSLRHRKTLNGIEPSALAAMMAYRWPGNVRELENAIERAFVLCENGGAIELRHLPQTLRPKSPARQGGALREKTRETELKAIAEALGRNGGSRQKPPRSWACTEPPSSGR